MLKNETISLAEKLWKDSADARTKKVIERATILINLYYHLKKRSEDELGANASTATDKKLLEEKLATIQRQLEKIEEEVKRWQKDVVGELEQTLTIDQLTKVASNEVLDKSSVGVATTIHQLMPRTNIPDQVVDIPHKNFSDPGKQKM